MADVAEGHLHAPSRKEEGLVQPKRTWAAIAIWAALILSMLDTTIVNVALPTLAHELDATADRSIWVVNGYQIAITMFLLPLAALGDAVGFKRIYLSGIALFVAASLSCTLAGSLVGLVVSRFAQGAGAAALMAVNGALVRQIYPRALLGRGIGYNALVIAASSAAGPSIASAVLAVASWRWLFAVNVPVGLFALAVGLRALPDVRGRLGRFAWGKACLLVATMAAFFLGSAGIAHGATATSWVPELVFASVGFYWITRISRGDPAPLLPIDLLHIRVLRLSYATSAGSFAAQMIAFVALPFLLQGRHGFDHVTIGLLMTPLPLATAAAAPIAGRLVETYSASLLGAVGLFSMAIAMAALASMPAGSAPSLIAVAMALAGAGFGLFQTPNNRTMLGMAPSHRSGAAAGMQATARLMGQTGGAIIVALLFRHMSSASAAPLWVAAALGLAAATTSLLRGGHSVET